ncbi:MAG TPA: ATP-binding protein [Candidatus Binataceae bacterium]|nr:ATP-binding protein [Candidatus Binataceae bacterium]
MLTTPRLCTPRTGRRAGHRMLTDCRGAIPQHSATDDVIEAEPVELEVIRRQLGVIEHMVAQLFGASYGRDEAGMAARAAAADVIDLDFDQIVEEWCQSIERAFGDLSPDRELMANALVRFVAHLRDPSDLRTYVYLRRHCQQGMLAEAEPSEFNIFHIALKQVILDHVHARVRSRWAQRVRDTVVAAIDERRLMVAQFYIESREQALKASEEKYRNSIDHAPDPMYELDPDTLVVMAANTAACELHGIRPENREACLIGKPLTEFEPPEKRPGVLKHIEAVKAHGSDRVLDIEIGGRFFDVHSALIPAGSRRFIQMILRDVTERHEMLDSLVKAERLAAAGTFASGVAHEVNNPLASISSLVQSLMPQETDPDRLSALRTIVSQITRISTTLKDLVNFARPAPAERRPLDLNAVINETLRLVAYNRRFDGIRIDAALAHDLAPALADHNGIQQVLLNLLINAADATVNGSGRIEVVTANQRSPLGEPRVLMRVSDNGCGIAPENLQRVFDPFFTTKAVGSGMGLGLSICQSIVLSNQGTIKVESQLGKGTTVTICLPVPGEESVGRAPGAAASLQ